MMFRDLLTEFSMYMFLSTCTWKLRLDVKIGSELYELVMFVRGVKQTLSALKCSQTFSISVHR